MGDHELYEILEVSRGASDGDIRRVYIYICTDNKQILLLIYYIGLSSSSKGLSPR